MLIDVLNVRSRKLTFGGIQLLSSVEMVMLRFQKLAERDKQLHEVFSSLFGIIQYVNRAVLESWKDSIVVFRGRARLGGLVPPLYRSLALCSPLLTLTHPRRTTTRLVSLSASRHAPVDAAHHSLVAADRDG